MSRSRRYWPQDLQDELFIKRPHAIEQLFDRAGYPRSYSRDLAEEELRAAVCEEIRAGRTIASNKNHSTTNDFVVRVEIPERDVVYPLVERGEKEGRFQFLIHTVFSREMYQQWSRDGKLGCVGDLPEAAGLKELHKEMKEAPKPLPIKADVAIEEGNAIIVFYKEHGEWREKRTLTQELNKVVVSLLLEGINLSDIRVFKEIHFDLQIKLGES